jgi:hypothetical protein
MKKRLLFSMSLALFGCKEPFCEQNADQSTGLVVQVLDDRYQAYDAKQGEDLSRFGIWITTPEQYKRVFDHCCASQLDSVDFDRFNILGLTTINQGRNSSYLRDVKRDDAAQTITYTVTEEYCKRSSPIDGKSNLVLVPRIPATYTVKFVRNQ